MHFNEQSAQGDLKTQPCIRSEQKQIFVEAFLQDAPQQYKCDCSQDRVSAVKHSHFRESFPGRVTAVQAGESEAKHLGSSTKALAIYATL